MVELVKTSLRFERLVDDRQLPNHVDRPARSAPRSATMHGSCSRCRSSSPWRCCSRSCSSKGCAAGASIAGRCSCPYVLPIPVIGVIFGQLLQFNGLVNQLLRAFGLGGLAQDWLGQPRWALVDDDRRDHLAELGFGIVLFLARLLLACRPTCSRRDGWTARASSGCTARITIPQLDGRDPLLRRRRGDHDGLLGLQLRLRDDERPGRPGRRDPGDGALHLPDRLPVPVARDRLGRGRHPLRARRSS